MKACFKCGIEKPLTEFYAHPRMADGHLNKCKLCTKQDVQADYARKRSDPGWTSQERERGREKYRRLSYAERYKNKSHKYQAGYRSRWPDKRQAHCIVNNAIRSGRLVKPDACQECGLGGRVHGHHPDYSKPLEVMWLCPQCHGRQHRKKTAA
jgi:hypothetical protein